MTATLFRFAMLLFPVLTSFAHHPPYPLRLVALGGSDSFFPRLFHPFIKALTTIAIISIVYVTNCVTHSLRPPGSVVRHFHRLTLDIY